jgi:hypothetical protein
MNKQKEKASMKSFQKTIQIFILTCLWVQPMQVYAQSHEFRGGELIIHSRDRTGQHVQTYRNQN